MINSQPRDNLVGTEVSVTTFLAAKATNAPCELNLRRAKPIPDTNTVWFNLQEHEEGLPGLNKEGWDDCKAG